MQGEHSAILSTFIKLPFIIKIFVLSIFEWPLKTDLMYSKATSSFLVSEMIAKVEMTRRITTSQDQYQTLNHGIRSEQQQTMNQQQYNLLARTAVEAIRGYWWVRTSQVFALDLLLRRPYLSNVSFNTALFLKNILTLK